jgi:hypothetical protein
MKTSFALWLAVVAYALAGGYAINTYWKHNAVMKVVILAPLGVVVLSILFEDQVWKIRHHIARRRALRAGPPPPQDMVTVHLRANSSSTEVHGRGDIYALQDELRQLLQKNKLGSFDGNEIGEDEAVLFLSGQDGEAVFGAIEPVLRACPLCRGGFVRISRCDSGSSEREVSFG